MFEVWPPSQTDQFGPYFHLGVAHLAGGFVAKLSSDRDRAMMVAVLRLLPTLAATVVRDVTTNPGEYNWWLAKVRLLSDAVPV
jgi:hypothetical protein